MSDITKPRRPRDPVIYMYLNVITEMVYVGSALYGLAHRHRSHMKNVRNQKKHQSRFYRALSEWPEWAWERVVLERCDDELELDAAEKRWTAECCALENNVGYNTYDARYLRTSTMGGLRKQLNTSYVPTPQLTPAEAGKLGAEKSFTMLPLDVQSKAQERRDRKARFAAMTPEERKAFFRECGKKGFEKSGVKKG